MAEYIFGDRIIAQHKYGGEAVVRRLADLIDPDGADPGPRDLARAWGWK